MSSIVEETRQKMDDLLEKKAQVADFFQKEIAVATKMKAEAEEAVNQAFGDLDSEALEAAKSKLASAESAIKMCEIQQKRVTSQRIIAEAESDSVIDSLLEYEKSLCAEYEAAIAAPLKKLQALTEEHKKAIKETEDLIQAWTANIHPNYRNFFGTLYKDGSNRADAPQPVHFFNYVGSRFVDIIEQCIKAVTIAREDPRR